MAALLDIKDEVIKDGNGIQSGLEIRLQNSSTRTIKVIMIAYLVL